MATYKGINGFAVQSLASDPSPSNEGQVWYNNATYAFKLAAVTTAGTWAAGGNMNTARNDLSGASNSQNAALGFGGFLTTSSTTASESYNGTSWTNTPSLSTPRYAGGGSGTSTAAWYAGGETTPGGPGTNVVTEEYNGSSWTSGGNINDALRYRAGSGTLTAGLLAGGNPPESAATEEYDGTSWTSGGNLNTARTTMGSLNGSGSQTASLVFGGYLATATNTAASESYNGTSWTSVNSMNTARRVMVGGGTQSLAFAAGGYTTAVTGATELWNGTSWTTNPNSMATARYASAGGGTQAAGIVYAGLAPGNTAATEEFTGPGSPVTKTITTS